MTGRYNWRSSLKEGVLFGYDTPLIEKSRPTIGSFLQSQGYKTACIGKWHLGFQWPLTDSNNPESIDFSLPLLDAPVDHGFDYFYGICGSLDMPHMSMLKIAVSPPCLIELANATQDSPLN